MDKLQDSVSLKRLLMNPDFEKFTKEVANFYVHEDTIVKGYTKQFISKEKLDELNYHVAQRNALGSILIAKEALQEDLEGVLDEASKENSNEG